MGVTGIKERPILFSSAMVQAILAGRKTKTRRVVKPQPKNSSRVAHIELMPPKSDGTFEELWWDRIGSSDGKLPCCPYGQPGDRLWVRETFFVATGPPGPLLVHYRADDDCKEFTGLWRPSIFMRRDCSRINLEITNVRVERVQDISGSDAVAEGIEVLDKRCGDVTRIGLYRQLWDSINAKRGFGWDKNPWVWVIEFKRL